jgi:RNA polymerase sigma-70 factor (ECF subfamily)
MARRIDEYVNNGNASFFVWLRKLAVQKIIDVHRRHLVAERRDVRRNVSLEFGPAAAGSSALLARQLLAHSSTPCRKAVKAELRRRLIELIESLSSIDRDILVLRHLEQLSNQEIAETMCMNASSVSTRHVRALTKLRGLMQQRDEFRDLVSADH